MNIQDRINQLVAEREKNSNEQRKIANEICDLIELKQKYEDITIETGRWGKLACSSKSVTDIVTDFDLRHNCGCCADSPLEIWPYLTTENGKVYSNPAKFVVGEKSWTTGRDMPYPDWDSKMREHNIPESIIQRIQEHFSVEVEFDDDND